MIESTQKTKRAVVIVRSIAFDTGRGGLERAASDHIRALIARGWEVTLLSPGEFTTGQVPMRWVDVPWPKYLGKPGHPGFGLAYWVWVRRAATAIASEIPRQDALYIHGAAAGVLRKLKVNERQRPHVVVNPHGMEEFNTGGILRWTNRVFTRHLARASHLADTVLATDEALISRVMQNFRVNTGQVHVIPNAVDIARLDALASAGASSVHTSADIVSIGRLVRNKGYDLLATALAELQKEAPGSHIKWLHFGDGPEAKRLVESAARVPGLNFELVGRANDEVVQASLRAAHMFVQPSRYEGSSLTTLEAMAQSAVCVGSPVGGIPEKLTDGVTGFLATDVSASAIARAIQQARSADSHVGSAARRRVEEVYSLEALGEGLDTVLSGPCASHMEHERKRGGS